MKVLWITNVEINTIAKEFGDEIVIGGWLEHTAELLSKTKEIELFIACNTSREYYNKLVDNITFFSFDNTRNDFVRRVSSILDYVKPDVLHIWGTEYIHSLRFIEHFPEKERAIVSIQGLVSVIPTHYYANIPFRVIYHRTPIEYLVHNIYQSKKDMEKNGKNEIKVLKQVRNCIGRTDWDYACVKQINEKINYYKVNEILREKFYNSREWRLDECEKNTVFFSQANYPLKGFHHMVMALGIIKKKYPDVKVKVLGDNPKPETISKRIKIRSYTKYIYGLIRKNNLEENIIWLGKLNAQEMVKQYLNANVFVCASSIENSSNSICEAMMLGVPVVAADVGGVKSLLVHEKEGLLYQSDAYYMLADAVCQIFENNEQAVQMGNNARIRALERHDRESIIDKLISVYNNLIV